MRRLSLTALVCIALTLIYPLAGLAQSSPEAIPPTEISADLGSCSALITVTGADANPVYNAKVTTRIYYGFLGVKKLDLETYTSAGGQVKIVKLPEVLKKPMYLYISKGELMETVEFHPDIHCRARFDVQLK